MTKLESIEKLREWAADEHTVCRGIEMETFKGKLSIYEKYALDTVIDWVEREIAEKHMLLPVDADGVPIRPGDLMTDGFARADGLGVKKWDVWAVNESAFFAVTGEPREPKNHYHVKPRTVEDVLRDFGVDAAHDLNANPDATINEATFAKYAAELQMRSGAE